MKKVLLFGFETLPEILTVAGIVQQFGGEAVPVAKESCGLTLEALAQGKTGRESGVPIGGKYSAVWSGNWTACWRRCVRPGSCA